MIVLPDTSVWSLALRRRKSAVLDSEEKRLLEALTEAVRDGRVAMIGAIRQELLSGIRDEQQFEKLRAALQAYPDEPLQTSDFESGAIVYNECRRRGVVAGPVDMLICAVAVRRTWDVLTRDRELFNCLQIAQSIAAKLT